MGMPKTRALPQKSKRFDGAKLRARKIKVRGQRSRVVRALCSKCHKPRTVGAPMGQCENCLRGHVPKRVPFWLWSKPKPRASSKAKPKPKPKVERLEEIRARFEFEMGGGS